MVLDFPLRTVHGGMSPHFLPVAFSCMLFVFFFVFFLFFFFFIFLFTCASWNSSRIINSLHFYPLHPSSLFFSSFRQNLKSAPHAIGSHGKNIGRNLRDSLTFALTQRKVKQCVRENRSERFYFLFVYFSSSYFAANKIGFAWRASSPILFA